MNKYVFNDEHGQTSQVFINPDHSNILCNLSGGADSALLAYLVVDYCQKYIPEAKINFITCANPVKGWYHAKFANRVLDAILKKTHSKQIHGHYVFYREDQTRDIIKEVEIDYIKRGLANTVFNALTQNPPSEEKHLQEGRFELRDPGHDRVPYNNFLIEGVYVDYHLPFVKADKRMVAHIYKELELDWLYESTRSCEQHWKDNDNDMEEHCGHCWWCKERHWAFGDVARLVYGDIIR